MLHITECEDGTQLCGTRIDTRGTHSRTGENLAYVNQQITQADATGPNQWEGSVTLNGSKAASTITQVAPDTIEIVGCRAMILCQSLAFNRTDDGASTS